MLTFVVGITAARIEQYHLIRVHVDLSIPMPDIAVHEDRLDISTAGLERSQEPWYDFLEKLVRNFVKAWIVSSYGLLPFNVGAKLTTIPFFPSIAPVVNQWDMTIERCHMETEFPCG